MKKILKLYADFSGRSNRKEYLCSLIILSLSFIPTFLWLVFCLLTPPKAQLVDLIIGLTPHLFLSLFIIAPFLALVSRRTHDMGLPFKAAWSKRNNIFKKSDAINQYGEVPISAKISKVFIFLLLFSYLIMLPLILVAASAKTNLHDFIVNENLKGIWNTVYSNYELKDRPFSQEYGNIKDALKEFTFDINDSENYFYLGLAQKSDDNLPLAIYRPRLNNFYHKILKKSPRALVVYSTGEVINIPMPYNSNNLKSIVNDIISASPNKISPENIKKIHQRVDELEKKYPSKTFHSTRDK